jgi:hypothetical protein
MKGGEIKIKYANAGRRAKNEITLKQPIYSPGESVTF